MKIILSEDRILDMIDHPDHFIFVDKKKYSLASILCLDKFLHRSLIDICSYWFLCECKEVS